MGRLIVSDPIGILTHIADRLDEIADILYLIEQRLIPASVADSVEFYQKIGGEFRKVDNVFMKIDQFVDLAVAFKDKLGNVAKVDGTPTWALTDDTLGKLDVGADGMTATFSPLAVGALKIQVKADADLGAGVTEIIGELDLEISSLDAVTVEIVGTLR